MKMNHTTKIITIIIGMVLLLTSIPFQQTTTIKADRTNENIIIELYTSGTIDQTIVPCTDETTQQLQTIIETAKERLENSQNAQETHTIFTDTITSLREHHFISDDNPIHTLIDKTMTQIEKFRNIYGFILNEPESNYLSLVMGDVESGRTHFHRAIISLLDVLMILFGLGPIGLIGNLLFAIRLVYGEISKNLPLSIKHTICLGNHYWPMHQFVEGWVMSYGLAGKKQWQGELIGEVGPTWLLDESRAITGFTGIKIYDPLDDQIFFLGTSTFIRISARD